MMRFFVSVFFSLLMPLALQAQTWGVGMYGGMQSCPYQTRPAQGASSVDDATKEIQSAIAEAQKQLRAKKSEKKKVDREVDRAKENVTRVIADNYADFIFSHIDGSKKCAEYKGYQGNDVEAQGQQGDNAIPNANLLPLQAFKSSEWNQYCDPSRDGGVSAGVCGDPRFKQDDGNRGDVQSCKKGLVDYRKNSVQSQKLQREIERLENSIARSKDDLKDAKQDAAEAARERQASGDTEGGICIECIKSGNGYTYQKPQTDWGSVIGNVALGLGSLYAGYKTNQMVTEANANIGWPTNPYASVGYGYGFGAIGTGVSQALGGGSGIYGAMSGGMGSGGFGCAGNNGGAMGMMGPYGGANGYGMWGNPYSMMGMNSMGGGIYNMGMGPWGMNGFMGSMPGMNNMGMGSMMMGSMMSGYMMGNMMSMGGIMGMGSMMGNMMGTMSSGMMDPSMMNLQMQQYQTMMQYQMQYQQQQMQRYQTVSSLQQEMYNLMYRIQQVQYGGTTTGYIGGTTNYTYNSNGITPLPGSPGYTGYSTISTIPSTISTLPTTTISSPIPSPR